MSWWLKLGTVVGSGVPDPMGTSGTNHPVPQMGLENKPAPGQRGPVGLSGRTTYSRVNLGTPPTPDAGASSQKSQPPRGLESLKTAQAETNMNTNYMRQPSLNEIIKVAMEGSAAQIDLSLEAARQLASDGHTPPAREQQKTAAPQAVPTELVSKLASGMFYLAQQMNPKLADVNFPGTENNMGPGKGPNTLGVMAATEEGDGVMEAGQSGKATPKNQVPMNPSQQKDPTRSSDPGTGLETNDAMMHGEQPVEPVSNEKTTLTNENVKASAAYANNLVACGLAKIAAARDGSLVILPTVELSKQAATLGQGVRGAYGGAAGGTAGAVGGGMMGAGLGAAGGALLGHATGLGAGTGALIGGAGGGALGAGAGGIYGASKGSQMGREQKASPLRTAAGGLAGGAGAARGAGLGGLAGAGAGALGGAALGHITGLGAGTGALIGGAGGGLAGAGLGTAMGAQQGYRVVNPQQQKQASVKAAAARMIERLKVAEGEEPEEGTVQRIPKDVKMWGPEPVRKGMSRGALIGAGAGALGGGIAGAASGRGTADRIVGGTAGALAGGLGGAGLGAGIGGAIGSSQLGEEERLMQEQAVRESLAAGEKPSDAGMRVAIQNRPRGMSADEAAQSYAEDIETSQQLGGMMGGGSLGVLGGGAAGGGLGYAIGRGLGKSEAAGEAGAALGGAAGAIGGGYLGGRIGSGMGQRAGAKRGAEMKQRALTKASSAIYERNLALLGLHKVAEDAINPAKISAGKTQVGATPPHGASPSEEGIPAEPSDVTSQKRKMVDSNMAAINYTKRDAKADPKADLRDVHGEPALSASTDTVLNQALDHTQEAGAKISSANVKLAAARALVAKIAAGDLPKKKVKKSMMGGGGMPASATGQQATQGAANPSGAF